MGMLPIAIFLLCLMTAALCTWLLLRGYGPSGTRLLLWTGLCFGFLSVNSAVVLLDILLFPTEDLRLVRHGATLMAVASLLIGLIWEGE